VDLKNLNAEQIKKLSDDKTAAILAILTLGDSATPEQRAEALSLDKELDEIKAEMAVREEASKAFAGLGAKFAEKDEEDQDEPKDEEPKDADTGDSDQSGAQGGDPAERATGEQPDADDMVPVEQTTEMPEQNHEPNVSRSSSVQRLAARGTQRPATQARRVNRVSLTAAADTGFAAGQKLESLLDVANAVIGRSRGFTPPQGDGQTEDIRQFGTATITLDFPEEMIVDRWEDADDAIAYASDESNLPGGSLVAAGGWCAPSEVSYDIENDATSDGLVSLPTIGVRRGGIKYAQSPVFSDFYANPGFKQTETQAIAGTTKPCVEVPCPTFTEVRLDAEGVCIKVPILTNAAYPEVVRNFVAGTLTAHDHWMNADVIARMVTFAGAARVFAGLGSSQFDMLEALGLVIDQTRQKYRLLLRATVEVVLPFWIKNMIRNDIARRAGRDSASVADAEITSAFGAYGANVQFVYDWQTIDETAEVYPATFQALVYPAGTFVKGIAPVINLNTIYDAASLQTNVYTGLFTEQGVLVAKKKFHADLLTLPVCNAGRTGAGNLTCA
jgi:hypothetical protein